MIRRFILALALALGAGLAPAFAQAPAPVPALPDTERRTSYSISASTCVCAVNMQLYADSTDFQNWLEVWVNGINVAYNDTVFGWTITVPTGSLATRVRPISDAVLTFNSVQTGTVQIVGARRPRRVAQFAENTGVPARNLNQALTDIVAMQREAWDKITDVSGRTVQAPAGETLKVLPALSGRASMNACFDSGGNLTSCVGASSGSFAAGNGILFAGTNPTTITNNIQAGNGVAFTGTNPITINAATYVMPNFVCDGTTDFGAQLQALINANTGKTILIPAGPACVVGTTITLPSNTTITGAGREVSILKGKSTLVNSPIFSATNQTNISLSNFWMQGVDSANNWKTASPLGAFAFTQDASATSDQTYSITGMKFSGFNASYWAYISSTSTTFFQLKDVTFSNNLLVTTAADIPTDVTGGTNNNTNYGFIIQSSTVGHGGIVNLQVKNNRMEATAMCFPIVVFANSYKTQITDNLITDVGQTTPAHCLNGTLTTDLSYGVLIYDANNDGNPPQNFLISNNTIISPYGTGIYVVGDGTGGHTAAVYNSSRSIISNNLIDGQVSQTDVSLPRAAIVLSLLSDVDITGNKVVNSFGGISANGQMNGVVNIVSNSCTTGVASGASTPYCYRLGSGSNGSSNTSRHILKGNYGENVLTGSGNVIVLGSATGARFNDVEISDNTINAGWNGLLAQNQFFTGSFVIKNNKFGGVANSFMASVSSLTGSPVAIVDNVFDSSAGVNGNALQASSSVIHMANNKFINRTSGAVSMFSAGGACGTIVGTQFNNVLQAAQVAVSSLGTSNPSSCTLNYLDQVQNLSPAESGAASSKYVVDHWLHVSTTASTTHLDQRQLTGN